MGLAGNLGDDLPIKTNPYLKGGGSGQKPVVVPSPTAKASALTVKCDARNQDEVESVWVRNRSRGRRFEDPEAPLHKLVWAGHPMQDEVIALDPWEGDFPILQPGLERVRLTR